MPPRPTLTRAVFHPAVLDRTNTHLEAAGYRLTPIESTTDLSILEMQALDGTPQGIRLTQAPNTQNLHGVQSNFVNAFFDGDQYGGSNGAQVRNAMLTTLAEAEDKAHLSMGDTTRPRERALYRPVEDFLRVTKGRFEASGWHQPVPENANPIPQPIKAIPAVQAMDIIQTDGTILRVNKDDVIGMDETNTLNTYDDRVAIVPIADRTTDRAAVYQTAKRYCAAYSLLTQEDRPFHPEAPHIAVFPEEDGKASLVSLLPDMRVSSWAQYTSVEQAAAQLPVKGPVCEEKHQRMVRSMESVSKMANAFSQDGGR